MDTLLRGALALGLLVNGLVGEFSLNISPNVVRVGEPVLMTCTAVNEDFRVNIDWVRFNGDNHEVIGVNSALTQEYLANRDPGPFILDPDVEYNYQEMTMKFRLNITAAQVEDNAAYGCDRESSVSVKQLLQVTTAPDDIPLMYGSNNHLSPGDVGSMVPLEPNQLIEVTPSATGYFMCIAEGFIPEPTMSIDFDGEELTHFEIERTKAEVSSEGNPEYTYTTHGIILTSTRPLEMNEGIARKSLRCTASLEGYEPVSTNIRPVLRVPPSVECSEQVVTCTKEEQHVTITCVVDAEPEADVIRWSWVTPDGHFHQVASGEVMDAKYRSTQTVLEDGRIESSMVFDRVFAEQFVEYKLFAQNSIGNASGTVELVRDPSMELSISCREDVSCAADTRRVALVCVVETQAECTSIHWTWPNEQGGMVRLMSGAGMGAEYNTTHTVLEEGRVEAAMVFERVLDEHFGIYTITAESLMETASTSVELSKSNQATVECKPDTMCPRKAQNQSVSCVVSAPMACSAIKWTWTTPQGKHVEIASGQYLDGKYQSRQKVLEDGRVESSMFFKNVHTDQFGEYTIHVESILNDASATVALVRDPDAEASLYPDSSAVLYPSGVLLLTVNIAIWRLL